MKKLICAHCGPKDAQLFPPREMKKPEGARRWCRSCVRRTNRMYKRGLGRMTAKTA